jgi:hypothetical protein
MRRSDFSISSIVFGSLSIVAGLLVRHAKAVWDPREGQFLTWMDSHGLVHASTGLAPEFRPSGLITFTDESVLFMLVCFGIYLAVTSMLFALWAEHRGEENLYLSVGFILGALGLTTASFPIGVVAMVSGAWVVLVLRKRRGASS